ncbi:hypothetical protein HWV62_12516 [Athelia sp. TMB]|nr:hypothetical protein HWV62_12516 [Athelia sp. TMB]
MWSKPSKDIRAARSHTLLKALSIPWECMLLYDSLVLLLTVTKTYRTAHEHAASGQATSTVHIPTLILRDEPFRDLIVLQPLLKGTLSSFNSVIGVVLVSRMVLNLRGVAAEAREDSQASWGNLRTTAQPQSRDSPGMELSSISPLSVARSTPAKRAPFPGQDERADVKDFGPVLDISRARIIEITNLRNVSLV